MPWFNKNGETTHSEKEQQQEVEFKPEKFKEEITSSFSSKFDEMKAENEAKFKPLLDMAESLRVEREERAATARTASEKKNKEDNELTSDDFMIDPVEATRRANQPIANATMMLAARMAKQEFFADKPYYTGAIKDKIDNMLSHQALGMQSRHDVIENCYKVVMFDHADEIKDGKIKARNSAGSFESTGTGGHSGKTTEDSAETLTAEEKLIASKFNMNDADWIKSRKELQFV